MEYKRCFFLSAVCLLLLGCAAPAAESEYTPTAESAVDVTEAAAQPPTATPTAATPQPMMTPTITKTPTSTPVPTETPDLSFLHTLTPEATPRPFATIDPALSPPAGQLLFLWSAKPPVDGLERDYTTNLYTIDLAGKTPSRWQPEILLSDLFGFPLMLSSRDTRKLTMRFSPDKNSALHELYSLGIYDIESRSWQKLSDTTPGLYSFDWMPDNESVIYTIYASLYILNVEVKTDELFSNAVDEDLQGITIAPNGQSLTLISKKEWPTPSPLSILDIDSGLLTDVPRSGLLFGGLEATIDWSLDGRWLLYSEFNRGLSLINTASLEIIQLREPEAACYPAWSPTAVELAYTCDGILYFWSADTPTDVELLRQEALGPPVWSPDGKTIISSFAEGEESGFVSIEVEEMLKRWMPLESLHPDMLFKPVFSPDGKWLLFISDRNDFPEVYLISMLTLDLYSIFSIEDNALPYDFFWSSNS